MAGAAAVNTLRSMGVITFASAGNDGSPALMSAPGCLSNVVSVGATNNLDQVAPFSNSSPTTDIFAPGVALLIDSGDALTPAAIETRLKTSPVQVVDPKNGLRFPRIDCSYSAIASLRALIDRVEALGLPGGSANSYLAPLNQALASLQAGNVTLAQKRLTAFANHVRSETGDQLTQAQADVLLLQVGRVSEGAQKGYL